MGRFSFVLQETKEKSDLALGSVRVQNMKIRETDKGQTAQVKISRGNRRSEVCLASFVTLSGIVISNIKYIIPAPGGR